MGQTKTMHSITQAFSFRPPPKCILVYEQNDGKAEQSKDDHAGQDGSMLPKQSTTFQQTVSNLLWMQPENS